MEEQTNPDRRGVAAPDYRNPFNGVAANLSDRAYFQSGMKGEAGITYVARSRVTGQKQLGFYAPVHYEGET